MFSPEFMLDVVVKATVLLLIAVVVDLGLKNSTAAMRHRVWGATFIALLILPFLSSVAPQWRLAVLPADWSNLPAESAVTATAADSSLLRTPAPSESQNVSSPMLPDVAFANTPSELLPVVMAEQQSILDQFAAVPVESDLNGFDEQASALLSESIVRFAPVLWLFGAAVTLWPLLVGLFHNAVLKRTSRRVTEDESTTLVASLCDQLGLRRRVSLLETDESIVPMTCGILKPMVVIPAVWRQWIPDGRRLVLLHELAHVKRWDVAYQTVARLVVSIYWFHPLGWYALRRLRIERELACDDCVLMAGERPTHYAKQLLEIAREYQLTVHPPAVAMAQRSGLEQRVQALFDKARSHLPISRPMGRAVLTGAIVATSMLAIVRLETVIATEPENGSNAVTGLVDATVDSEMLEIAGQVRGPDDEPVAGARVLVIRVFQANGSWLNSYSELTETTSDAKGNYRAKVPSHSDRFSDGIRLEKQSTHIITSKPGLGPDETLVGDSPTETNLHLALANIPIEGRIVDLEGEPISDVRVTVVEVDKPATDLDEWIEKATDNPAIWDIVAMEASAADGGPDRPTVANFPAGERIVATSEFAASRTTTDTNGRFRIDGIGDDRLATIRIDAPGIASVLLQVVTRDMAAVNHPSIDPRYRSGKAYGSRFVYSAEPEQLIRGTIRNKTTGEGIAGVNISLLAYDDNSLSVVDFLNTKTDDEGRYELAGVPKARENSRGMRLLITPSGTEPYFPINTLIPKQALLNPVPFDLSLEPAIWIEGQVTDAVSGNGVPSFVAYYPYLDNPHAENQAVFKVGNGTTGDSDLLATDKNGHFRVPGLPGHGSLRVVAKQDRLYKITPDVYDGEANMVGRRLRQELYNIGWPGNTMVELDIPDDASVHSVIAPLTPYQTQTVHVSDMEDKDVAGYWTAGHYPRKAVNPSGYGLRSWEQSPQTSAQTIVSLGSEAERQRPIMFYHRYRKIGAIAWLPDLEPNDQGEYSITLRACGTITGRLVDATGRSINTGYVMAGFMAADEVSALNDVEEGRPRSIYQHLPFNVQKLETLTEDGRFSYTVPPGDNYAMIQGSSVANQMLFTGMTIAPGEIVDLGEIDITADASTWPKPIHTPAVAGQ